MIHREYFHDLGVVYLVVDAHACRGSTRPGGGGLERVPRHEVRWIIERVARQEPALLTRLYQLLTPGHSTGGVFRSQAPTVGIDPRLQLVLQAFGMERGSGPFAEGPDFAKLYMLRRMGAGRPSEISQETAEGRRIGEALSKLGRAQFLHRGEDYWFMQATSGAPPPRNRTEYETLSETQLLAILRELLADPATPQHRKEALIELLGAAEAQRAKEGRIALLLLRRKRSYALPVEQQGPSLTPSQLRKELHWVEISAVDKAEKRLPDLQLEVELADGTQKLIRTNADGIGRLEGIPPGNVKIRLPQLDGKMWKPLGGAGASPSAKQPPARTHVFRSGDTLARIARRNGFESWKALWETPKNAALREQRKRANMVRPGDKVNVEVAIHEIVRASDAIHKLQVLRDEKPFAWSC